ncbi:MAG: hypothetical protein IPP23_10050 [Sphingomonadales bacterium]|nr:hypothetical protein [Sphingomonadales bacterium]
MLAPTRLYFLPGDLTGGMQAAVYTLFVAGMAGCAWKQHFLRYRVGPGAMGLVRFLTC